LGGAVVFLALMIIGLLVPTPELKYSLERKSDAVSDEVVKDVVRIFQENCKPLMDKYHRDIEHVSVTVYRQYPGDFVYDTYGWENQIEISVKIAEDPSRIPSSYEAGGHTLHFVMGGGAHPGFFTFKRPALCGLQEVSPKKNVFSSVPELSIIGD
jgi:hypothetical protein